MGNGSKYQITDMENKVPEMHRLRDSPTKGTWKKAYADSGAQTLQHRGSETPRCRNAETLRHTFQWLTVVQGYARTWGCTEIETLRHLSWNTGPHGHLDTEMHRC